MVIDESRHSFLSILKLAERELRRRKVDILHSHRYKENVLAALLKRRRGVRCLVQTVHGVQERLTGFKNLKIRLYERINDYVTRRYFDRIQPVSHDICRQLSRKFDESRLTTIHNAVDTKKIAVRRSAAELKRELKISSHQPVLGAVGRMVPIKGFNLLLEAARLILAEEPNVRFLLIGDGPQRADYEAQSEALGLTDTVQFLGFRSDVTDIINLLDLFVMTSYHEGIPTVLLEAMVMRKAVVATNVGGIPEVIEDDVSGVLITPGDINSIASACIQVLRDSKLRERLGSAAKAYVEEEFSSEVQGKRALDMYKKLIRQQ